MIIIRNYETRVHQNHSLTTQKGNLPKAGYVLFSNTTNLGEIRTFHILCEKNAEVTAVDICHLCTLSERSISKQVKIFLPIHACLKSWNGVGMASYLSATLIITISPAL
jgi:hypothetical protein